jgi:hypothetical protein
VQQGVDGLIQAQHPDGRLGRRLARHPANSADPHQVVNRIRHHLVRGDGG